MERIILKARSLGISTYAQGVCDAEAKTGSAAGIKEAAKEAAPFGELEKNSLQLIHLAGSKCLI